MARPYRQKSLPLSKENSSSLKTMNISPSCGPTANSRKSVRNGFGHLEQQQAALHLQVLEKTIDPSKRFTFRLHPDFYSAIAYVKDYL